MEVESEDSLKWIQESLLFFQQRKLTIIFYSSDIENLMDDPGLLSSQVYQSKAYQIYLRLRALSNNYFVFERNYRELNRLLSAAQHPNAFQMLWIQSKNPRMEVVMLELGRLLANFIASAKTLVEHTRELVRGWYSGTRFWDEYQSEVDKRFTGKPIAGFIEDLRNYVLHFRLPFAVAVLRFRVGMTTSENVRDQAFVLSKAELLKWDGWTEKGKSYLETANEEIPVQKVVDMYFQEVNAFHAWMQQRLKEIHANDLRWLAEMGKKIKKTVEGI